MPPTTYTDFPVNDLSAEGHLRSIVDFVGVSHFDVVTLGLLQGVPLIGDGVPLAKAWWVVEEAETHS